MFKNQKGITLIALVITIIVLLILAGVTIAMLTGSDSAPAKANEAKQKQDIGAAKDQVYIAASKLQTEAYEDVYVKGIAAGTTATGNAARVTKGNASTSVGTYVGTKLSTELPSGKRTVGNATIEFSDSKPSSIPTGITVPDKVENSKTVYTQYITISTTDFVTYGWIAADGGVLSWATEGIVNK